MTKTILVKIEELGFKRVDFDVSDPEIYAKHLDNGRSLSLQLWSDGNHRVSHWIGGRMTTIPTDFTDLDGMIRAIEVESTRMDHPDANAP